MVCDSQNHDEEWGCALKATEATLVGVNRREATDEIINKGVGGPAYTATGAQNTGKCTQRAREGPVWTCVCDPFGGGSQIRTGPIGQATSHNKPPALSLNCDNNLIPAPDAVL